MKYNDLVKLLGKEGYFDLASLVQLTGERRQSLKPTAFFGYRPMTMGDKKVVIADPEKALLDLWYLEQGAWSQERMEAMRFQNQDVIKDHAKRSRLNFSSSAVGRLTPCP